MRTNLRVPASVVARRRWQPGRWSTPRASLSSAAGSAISASMSRARDDRRGVPRPPACSAWCICPASAPTSASSTNSLRHAPRSTPRTPCARLSGRARSCGRASIFGPEDVMFNRMAQIAAKAPFLPVVGDGSAKVQPVYRRAMSAGAVGEPSGAAWRRPRRCSSWAARASTPIARSPRSCCARSTGRSGSSACRPA